jgi:cyclophilin family peptidyl-prolyl cis-trans isomerase
MGKIKKIKQERKRAEVEAQLAKMKFWRNFWRGVFASVLLIVVLSGGYLGYRQLTLKYPNFKISFGSKAPKNETRSGKVYEKAPEMQIDTSKKYLAKMETSQGTIEIELDPTETPKTVNNFVVLAKDGFYDGLNFHRIVKDFMIQGGDPSGNGTGGPGYKFDDEKFSADYAAGTIAMANSGPNTNGSQFFIMTGDYSGGKLPKNYTIFGKVVSGLDIVQKIGQTPTEDNGQGEQSKPKEAVTINKVTIEEK